MGFCGNDTADYLEDWFIQRYKKKVMAIIPKFTGMLSFLCSGFLVQHILHLKKQRKSPYSRIIIGLSTADIFFLRSLDSSSQPGPCHLILSWPMGLRETHGRAQCKDFSFSLDYARQRCTRLPLFPTTFLLL